jgi:hypothetical protein
MKIATSPTSTGNPGQPRDLQFSRPNYPSFVHREETTCTGKLREE